MPGHIIITKDNGGWQTEKRVAPGEQKGGPAAVIKGRNLSVCCTPRGAFRFISQDSEGSFITAGDIMGSPDDEKNILELLCQKKRSTQYIHVFPGELKVYSLLDAGIRDKKGKRCLLEVRMMEFTRESLARFSAKGTPIPVRFVELPINGHEEEVKAFLQMLRKTGILLDIGGAIYGVSRTAMMKMHKQMEMYGAYDYSPIHDLMLAEKLIAAEPSGNRPTEKKTLERVDKKNAKGYTLAVSTKPFPGSSFVDGIITGMYSGWYEGTDGDGLDILCAKLLKGEIIGGEEIEMCHQENTAEHLTVEFRAGKPFRYAVSGQEHCLERGIVITDYSSGFQAFSVRGIISDRKTGDRIIVSEKKLSHYGRSKRCTDRQKKETDTAESRVRTVFAETEEFIRLIEKCLKLPERYADLFLGTAVSAGIRECVGKKRTAALFGEPPGSMEEALHRIIHIGSAISSSAAIKDLPVQEREELKKITAGAVRQACLAMEDQVGGMEKIKKAGKKIQ